EAGNADRPQRKATDKCLVVHTRTVHRSKLAGKQNGLTSGRVAVYSLLIIRLFCSVVAETIHVLT
ncbi:MAG: hypothetical protein ACPG37_08735, partial [Luminiphilus sp.]